MFLIQTKMDRDYVTSQSRDSAWLDDAVFELIGDRRNYSFGDLSRIQDARLFN